jgi:hypothetical protein
MKEKLAIAVLGGALAVGLAAAASPAGLGQTGVRQAQVGQVTLWHPGDPPVITH